MSLALYVGNCIQKIFGILTKGKGMILSDKHLRELGKARLLIEPLNLENIQPASVDLTLSDSFLLGQNNMRVEVDEIEVKPLQFLLGSTVEAVNVPRDHCAFVHGRSSVGRNGLFVQNAGLIDPGFSGNITLELFNASQRTLKLRAGMLICQITFHWLTSPSDNPYNGKYVGQTGVTASKEKL